MQPKGYHITGTNRVVDALNKKILTMLHGEEFSLFSVTRLCSDDTRIQNLMSTEFLNSLRSPGVPEHVLKLKLNCLCMVTRPGPNIPLNFPIIQELEYLSHYSRESHLLFLKKS